MLKSIEDTLNKNCLIGLSYFDVEGNLLKQTKLAGQVKSVDKEMGITIVLLDKNGEVNLTSKEAAHFIIPTDLSCWFNAPKGEFHTSQKDSKIIDPDYLVTWDIYQTKSQDNQQANQAKKGAAVKLVQDGEQQWWQWHPRTEPPKVG